MYVFNNIIVREDYVTLPYNQPFPLTIKFIVSNVYKFSSGERKRQSERDGESE